MSRTSHAPVRITAAATLLAVFGAVPAAVVSFVGLPRWAEISAAASTGRINDGAIVSIGTTLFLGLWAWFALTALAEAVRVLAWRGGDPTRSLTPVTSSPSGMVKRLVRVALISTTVAVTTVAPMLRNDRQVAAYSAAPISAPVTAPIRSLPSDRDPADALRSSGRETPYSVAVRLGDVDLRTQIIELNAGRMTPAGGTWSGGVFPAGMTVVLPVGAALPHTVTWTTYTVVHDDSVYRIATSIAEQQRAGDGARVRDVADQILERNLGRRMIDGAVFDDASLIQPGWQLDVPVAVPAESGGTAQAATPATGAVGSVPASGVDATPSSDALEPASSLHHVVIAGDSYWGIAEAHLERAGPATAHEIAMFSDALVAINAPLLGHDIETLLVPGDEVRWGPLPVAPPPAASPMPASPTTSAPADTAAVDTDDTVVDTVDSAVDTVDSAVGTDDSAVGTDDTAIDTDDTAIDTSVDIAADTATAMVPVPVPPRATDAASEPGLALSTSAATGESPINRSLAGAVLVAAGAIGLIESRRRRMLRGSTPRTRLTPPSPEIAATERVMRSLDSVQRSVRLDLALRSAGHALGSSGGHVLAVFGRATGELTLVVDRAGMAAPEPWTAGGDTAGCTTATWHLAAHVTEERLAEDGRLSGQPCPTLVQLGTVVTSTMVPGVENSELFVDLEAFGMLCIDGPDDATGDIIRGLVASLQLSPVGQMVNIVGHRLRGSGADPTGTGDDLAGPAIVGTTPIEHTDSLDDALDRAAVMLGSTPTAISGRRTFELRSRGTGGETWEPVVLISAESSPDAAVAHDLVAASGSGGRGLAVVLAGAVDGAGLTLRAATGAWMLDRLGVGVVPVGISVGDRAALVDTIVGAADVITLARPQDLIAAQPIEASPVEVFADAEWELMVHTLGTVAVTTRCGETVAFERGKALELVVWLTQHREQSTRVAARTALWELNVRDATFANVVSDARRAMARASTPHAGDEWIERTLTEALPLHPLVITDAELLRARMQSCAGLEAACVVQALRPALELVTGMPFASTAYLWPDAEGLGSALTMLVTSAATECARSALQLDDIDTVFWATGQGLKVLAGHEELIGLRMRAHAQRGDRAGVRNEFTAYERALHADTFSDEEPSPKVIELLRELLAQRERTIA